PLSVSRRLACDLLRAARDVPTVCAERRMELGDLVAARRLWDPRPFWSSIIIKAYALVAADMAPLRRSYARFPWPHLYQHRTSVATITMERDYQGEETVVLAHARSPHTWPLAGLDAHLRHFKEAP